MTPASPRWAVRDLTALTVAALETTGMSPEDAGLLADSLVTAEASGVTTHGLTRLVPYLAQLRSGQVAARPDERVVAERPATVLVDAGRGFGAPVGIRTVDRLIDKAAQFGVAIGGVTQVAHFGAAAYFTRHAADRGFLAFAMSSTSPSVVPFGGRGPRIGNSPMSFAAPGLHGPELVMDMAQSVSSRGRIKQFQEQGRALPPGWAVDAEGRPTQDPTQALTGGVLPSGGHKGSALSLMVEMLASGLTGAHLSQDIQHGGFTTAAAGAGPDPAVDVTVGNCFLVIDADAFDDAAGVRARATSIADHVRTSAPAVGTDRVLAPGDPEAARSAVAAEHGIDLSPGTAQALTELAAELGLPVPAPINDDQGNDDHGHHD